MKKFAKILAVTMCAVLLVAASIAGTMAYLTSTKAVENTFTAGKVAITLDEVPTDEYGNQIAGNRVTSSSYKLIPGRTYQKQAEIHIDAESEACYLFVKLDATLLSIDNDTIENQLEAKNWLPLSDVDNVTDANNVYYYNGSLDTNVPVIDTFTVDTAATSETLIAFNNASVTIIAYAVQKDGLTLDQAWNAVKDTTPN